MSKDDHGINLRGSVCILQLCFYKLFQGHGRGKRRRNFPGFIYQSDGIQAPNDTPTVSLSSVWCLQHSRSIIRIHVWWLRHQVLCQRSHNFPLTSQWFFFFLVIVTALLSLLISLRWLQAAKPNPWVNPGFSIRSQTKVLTDGLEWPWTAASVASGLMATKGEFYSWAQGRLVCLLFTLREKKSGSHLS